MTNKEYNKIAKAVQKETRKGDEFIDNIYKFENESKRIERKAKRMKIKNKLLDIFDFVKQFIFAWAIYAVAVAMVIAASVALYWICYSIKHLI